MDYLEVRNRFFHEINEQPENYTLIAHNCAAALSKIGATPVISEATLFELAMRWELAMTRRHSGK